MYIYIMRHGETDYNKNKILQGHIDTHLNETGRMQAKEAAEYMRIKNIRFDKVYVSPLDRAQETAEIVGGQNRDNLIVDDRLIEIDYGEDIDGKCLNELDKETINFLNNPIDVLPPEGVERISHLMKRVHSFIRENIIKKNKKEQILIITHGETIRAFFACMIYISHINNFKIDDICQPQKNIKCIKRIQEFVWGVAINNCDLFYIRYKNKKFSYPVLVDISSDMF